MKKVLLTLALVVLLFAAPAFGQVEWVTANQVTIGWDAVTDAGGGPIPSGDTVLYRVYIKDLKTDAESMVGETDTLTYTITFISEGRYIAGVQAIRVPEGETQMLPSTITWSNSTDAVAVPNPFAFVYYENPLSPAGLRRAP